MAKSPTTAPPEPPTERHPTVAEADAARDDLKASQDKVKRSLAELLTHTQTRESRIERGLLQMEIDDLDPDIKEAEKACAESRERERTAKTAACVEVTHLGVAESVAELWDAAVVYQEAAEALLSTAVRGQSRREMLAHQAEALRDNDRITLSPTFGVCCDGVPVLSRVAEPLAGLVAGSVVQLVRRGGNGVLAESLSSYSRSTSPLPRPHHSVDVPLGVTA